MASKKRPFKVAETSLTNERRVNITTTSSSNNNNNNKSFEHGGTRPSTLSPGGSLRPPSATPNLSRRMSPVSPLSPLSPVSSSRQTMAVECRLKRKKEAKMRRIQASVYDFLERPKDYKSVGYQLIMFLVALVCLLLSVLSTVDKYEQKATDVLIELEILTVVWFSIEFVLRLWSAGCRSRYQNMAGRLQFLKRPLCLLDVFVILASMTILCFRSDGRIFTTSALGGLRFFQILRMLRIDRRGGSWKLLGSVIWAHRQELFTTLYIGFLGLIFFSFLIYIVEKDKNPARFGTYPDALWWGVVTLCTVGYGDAVPVTWLGKLVASCCALLGISFFALPAGILGSGFALKVQQQQRQKHLTRRKGPAAVLIQSLWRCHAAEESFHSTATWMVHVQRLSPKTNALSTSGSSQKFRMNSSFISRLSIRRKDGYAGSHQLHGNATSATTTTTATTAVSSSSNNNNAAGGQSDEGKKKNLIRRTYSGNAEPSSRYALLNAGSKLKRSHISFQDVVVLQNSPMAEAGSKKDHDNDLKGGDSNEDVLQCARVDHLTPTHKTAIRAIRKIKFFVARRIFKEALKPYDVKDVIEQYTAGHLDMLTRVKDLQTRLDLIIGHSGSVSPEISESRISMVVRIMKIEKQVSCIESKLDTLVEMHRSMRCGSSVHTRTDSIPSNQSSECNDLEQTSTVVGRRRLGPRSATAATVTLAAASTESSTQRHERAYKQLSEPLSSSESMRKEQHHHHHHHHHHHLSVAQESPDQPEERRLPPYLLGGSDRSVVEHPQASRSTRPRWDRQALVDSFDSSDIVRSEMTLNRLDCYDDDDLTAAAAAAVAAVNDGYDAEASLGSIKRLETGIGSRPEEIGEPEEDVPGERQTLYTLSEHTSVTSTNWSNSASTSLDSDVKTKDAEATKCRDGVNRCRLDYEAEMDDSAGMTPEAVESSEYEPLLTTNFGDSPPEYSGCRVIRNKCSRYDYLESAAAGRSDSLDAAGLGGCRMSAIPLLDPLFAHEDAESGPSNQCPSIFLTMPSNERICSMSSASSVAIGDGGCSGSTADHRGPGVETGRLSTISRSVSALCSFDELP